MKFDSAIYVSGHKGLLGRAVMLELQRQGFHNLWAASREEVDLTSKPAVDWYFNEVQPEYVFHCAAKVGGIEANSKHGSEFLRENLTIQNNVMTAAARHGVKGFQFVGSAAMYPDLNFQTIAPEDLMHGQLDETKDGYAMAKLAGMQLCKCLARETGQHFFTVIPNNIYGVGDNYNSATSHVVPAMLRKYHEGKKTGLVRNWGTGLARREFIFCRDVARAMVFLMLEYKGTTPVNIGVGEDVCMMDLAKLVAQVTGFDGKVEWDATKPEGTSRRLLDSSVLLNMGWRPEVTLFDGLKFAYTDFCLCQSH